eukprot:2917613-Rhodomonas_salina.2
MSMHAQQAVLDRSFQLKCTWRCVNTQTTARGVRVRSWTVVTGEPLCPCYCALACDCEVVFS